MPSSKADMYGSRSGAYSIVVKSRMGSYVPAATADRQASSKISSAATIAGNPGRDDTLTACSPKSPVDDAGNEHEPPSGWMSLASHNDARPLV